MNTVAPSGNAQKGPDPRETFLSKIFAAKAAVYAKNMKAGIGLQILSLEVLKKMLRADGGDEALRKLCTERIYGKLSELGIGYGVDDAAIGEAVDAFLEQVVNGIDEVVARQVAEGDPPVPAKDGRIEYLLNPDNLPMHKVKGVAPNSDKVWLKVVRKGEKLIQVFPPEGGKPGRNVLGEEVSPGQAQPRTLSSVQGQNTAVSDDCLIAACDGAYEEHASGRIRVVPEVSVRAVDATTGSLPDAGVSKANILVRSDVKSPYGLASSETAFIGLDRDGGVIESGAYASAKNLVVRGTILGDPNQKNGKKDKGLVVEAQDLCVAREIDGRQVRAENLLVMEDCRVARIDADAQVRVDGDLVGGVVTCHQGLTVAGNLGSEDGGSHTQIIVPAQGTETRKTQRLAQNVQKHKIEIAEIQERLAQLEAANAKRAKSNSYWSALLAEDLRQPRTSFEANTLRQFKDMLNQKKAMVREQAALRLETKRLQGQLEETEADDGSTEFQLRVGGKLNLDVRLVVIREMAEDDLGERVDYKLENTQFSNVTLQDIQSRLSALANDYVQKQATHNDARKQAIDKMFEGRDKRPTGPQIEHKQFEMAFEWHRDEGDENGDAEEKTPFHIQTTAFVDTQEPRKLRVRTEAKAREVIEQPDISVSQEGARVGLNMRKGYAKSLRWQDDSAVCQLVNSLCVKGLPGMAFLRGEDMPEQDAEADVPIEELSEPDDSESDEEGTLEAQESQ